MIRSVIRSGLILVFVIVLSESVPNIFETPKKYYG